MKPRRTVQPAETATSPAKRHRKTIVDGGRTRADPPPEGRLSKAGGPVSATATPGRDAMPDRYRCAGTDCPAKQRCQRHLGGVAYGDFTYAAFWARRDAGLDACDCFIAKPNPRKKAR